MTNISIVLLNHFWVQMYCYQVVIWYLFTKLAGRVLYNVHRENGVVVVASLNRDTRLYDNMTPLAYTIIYSYRCSTAVELFRNAFLARARVPERWLARSDMVCVQRMIIKVWPVRRVSVFCRRPFENRSQHRFVAATVIRRHCRPMGIRFSPRCSPKTTRAERYRVSYIRYCGHCTALVVARDVRPIGAMTPAFLLVVVRVIAVRDDGRN